MLALMRMILMSLLGVRTRDDSFPLVSWTAMIKGFVVCMHVRAPPWIDALLISDSLTYGFACSLFSGLPSATT